MSKLQNDFTTKQQSEKLLALGMPRLSANFYYDDENEVQIVKDPEFELQSKGYFPCWSVGRLIEILEIILGSPWSDKELLGKQGTLLERVVSDFEDVIKYKEIFKDNRIDFSKLEE